MRSTFLPSISPFPSPADSVFHALAIGLGAEEPRQEFEARIGGGGVARENRRDDQKGLQGAAPAFPAARTKIAPRNRFNGAISRPARNGKSAGHETNAYRHSGVPEGTYLKLRG